MSENRDEKNQKSDTFHQPGWTVQTVNQTVMHIVGVPIPLWLVLAVAAGVLITIGVVTYDAFTSRREADTLAEKVGTIQEVVLATATPTPVPTATPTVTPTPTLFPPATDEETLVLVADFVDPLGNDSRDVTADLVEGMTAGLVAFPNIRVERWRQAIPRENGSPVARAIGEQTAVNASIVIWGHYVSPPDPTLTIHFEMTKANETYLGSGFGEKFLPAQIAQPTLVEFQANLGENLAQVTALAVGATLFQASQHLEAVPLFDSASQALDAPLARSLNAAIHLYRGTKYLYLGCALEAQADLLALLPTLRSPDVVWNDLNLNSLNSIGFVYSALGEKEKALGYCEQALPLFRQVGDHSGEATTLNNIGAVYADLGEKGKALGYYEEALPLLRQVRDRSGEATTLNNIGRVYADLGEKEKALGYFEEALPLSRQVGDRSGEATALNNIGLVYADLGEKEKALGYYEQALSLSRQVGDPRGEATTLNNIAYIHFSQSNASEAANTLAEIIVVVQQVGDVASEASYRYNLAVVLQQLNRIPEAIAHLEQSIALLTRFHLPQDAGGATLAQHQAFLAQLRATQ